METPQASRNGSNIADLLIPSEQVHAVMIAATTPGENGRGTVVAEHLAASYGQAETLYPYHCRDLTRTQLKLLGRRIAILQSRLEGTKTPAEPIVEDIANIINSAIDGPQSI